MGVWARERLDHRVVGSAAAYAALAALTAMFLFGPSGRFGSHTGALIEFLNEIFGLGRHGGAAALIGLALFFLAPLAAGLVLRNWHWVWLAPLALVATGLVTWTPHLLAHERPVPLAAIPWVVVLFGVPAALGAAIGIGPGRTLGQPRTG